MNLLPAGTYQVCIHYLNRKEIDFTVMESGERYAVRLPLNPDQMLMRLNIALICQKGLTIDNPAGGQVELTIIVETNGERVFNRIKRIASMKELIPFETSVPTPEMLANLPVLDFEDIACS